MAARPEHNRVTGRGDWNAYCQSCGRKFKASQLRKRPEDNLMVCEDDWEPIHPAKFIRTQERPTRLTFISNNDPGDAGGTDVAGNSFPPAIDVSIMTELPMDRDYFNKARENFTVYKAVVNDVVTLPDGITMTVYTGGYIRVRQSDGTYTTYTAGAKTGASSGW